jgi:hypothetical protein
MKTWIVRIAATLLLSALSFGQATPISSTPDQQQAPVTQGKNAVHKKAGKVRHAKAHRRTHKKHHRNA